MTQQEIDQIVKYIESLPGGYKVQQIDMHGQFGFPMTVTFEVVDAASDPLKMFQRQQISHQNFAFIFNNPVVGIFDLPEIKESDELYIEPIVAYRDWRLTRDVDGRILLASRNEEVWPRYARNEAECRERVLGPHDAPHYGCQCGIYAWNNTKEGQSYWDEDHQDADVFGTVYLWGEILVAPRGYRAEFAYPKELFLRSNGTRTSERVREQLAEAYGVPVHLTSDIFAMEGGDTE